MRKSLPPYLVAQLDQRSALTAEVLDTSVAAMRTLLEAGISPEVAAEVLAKGLVNGGAEAGQLAVGYAYAVVRLAAQPGGGQ